MTAPPPSSAVSAAQLDSMNDLTPPSTSRVRRPVVMRHRVQYGALRMMLSALAKLGFRRASALGARIGRLGHRPFGIRRYVVERQIEAAFPDWDSARVEATARAAYENLGRTTIETALLPRLGREKVLELFDEPPGWHLMESALSRGHGVIMASGHIGNWELGGAYL